MKLAIIDYGVGNLRSVEKAFHAGGCEAIVSSDEKVLRGADKLVLPGVGAFAACMNELGKRGFDELVRERVLAGIPLLGVCVGMQMLFEESEEFGATKGLGFLRGKVKKFPESVLIPQVGWNQVTQNQPHFLFEGIADEAFFYFVHSYFCDAENIANVVGSTDYAQNYASIVAKENICGVQFHPEKSQAAGLKMLSNFAAKHA